LQWQPLVLPSYRGDSHAVFVVGPAGVFLSYLLSRSVLLRKRNVLDKFVEKIKTHILCSFKFYFPKILPFMRQFRKCAVEPDRPQMTIWRMRIACWIPKATNTHSQYVILIVFPLQQWLKEGAVVLRYTYFACLVNP